MAAGDFARVGYHYKSCESLTRLNKQRGGSPGCVLAHAVTALSSALTAVECPRPTCFSAARSTSAAGPGPAVHSQPVQLAVAISAADPGDGGGRLSAGAACLLVAAGRAVLRRPFASAALAAFRHSAPWRPAEGKGLAPSPTAGVRDVRPRPGAVTRSWTAPVPGSGFPAAGPEGSSEEERGRAWLGSKQPGPGDAIGSAGTGPVSRSWIPSGTVRGERERAGRDVLPPGPDGGDAGPGSPSGGDTRTDGGLSAGSVGVMTASPPTR